MITAKLVALIAFAFTLFIARPAFPQSQAAQEVTLCQLRQHAREFDHKLVRVRATASFEFEDFTLYDPLCKDPNATAIWLTFGGDVSDFATYCCGDHSRSPGHNLEVEGRSIPLLKDSAYEQFEKRLRASRNRMPDGEPCYRGCNFYRVSALFSGLFLAERDTGTEHIGYGHLGCCSLLIVQQVSQVSAERTAVPVGTFACENSAWKPNANEVPELEQYVRCTSGCDEKKYGALKQLAAHWNDSVTIENGSFNAVLDWTSDDLLTRYSFSRERTNPAAFSASRESCRPTGKNSSTSPNISCDEYATNAEWGPDPQREFERLIDKSEFSRAEKMMVASAEKLSSRGNQSWRTKSISEAAHEIIFREIRRWGVASDPDLIADKCTGPDSLDVQEYGYASCSWYSPDGMQQFTVWLLIRKTAVGNSTQSPWLFNGANARICRFDTPSTAGNAPTR